MVEEAQLFSTLKEYFGYDSFRPLQRKIIDSVLEKNDNLVIMPTGGGKSICFQLPALLMPGITLVISPLIALMKDQVDGLRANGIAAAFLNSSQSEDQRQGIYSKLNREEIQLLYVAPESLPYAEAVLGSGTVNLIAIDEAHCISSWGHDFRPAYTKLGYLKNRYPEIPLIALTATADKATRQDICNQLNIPQAVQHIASFDRKNLKLDVRPGTRKFGQILSFLDKHPEESGIIYCLSRKSTGELAEKLEDAGFKASAYHAGLSHEERIEVQEDFINDKTQIICATIAFGMGIDKSNVRWVIHYNMPKNLEGYYQEIGRAGRDGLPSSTLLFHSYADVVQLRKFAEGSGNADVQLAKLERMKQYSEALTCRRKILLSYFGELKPENCGNCDVCRNPPKFFNGTLLAQKALSAIYRLKNQEPISTVIDVLRGAQNTSIYEKGYEQLKTFGIASEIAWKDWQQYLIQLINLGYIEIAFHDHNKLQLTPLARKVLFEKEQVQLAEVSQQEFQQVSSRKEKSVAANSLFERLRKLRLELSREQDIPAYLVFSDAALKEMERSRPMTDEEFMQISGVGRQKMQTYGYRFIKEIIAYSKTKREKKRKNSGNTYNETLNLYRQGLSIEEMAQKRKLAAVTIVSHLVKLHREGEEIDLRQYVSEAELEALRTARGALDDPTALKPYYEHFEEAMEYQTIRMGLSILKKEG